MLNCNNVITINNCNIVNNNNIIIITFKNEKKNFKHFYNFLSTQNAYKSLVG